MIYIFHRGLKTTKVFKERRQISFQSHDFPFFVILWLPIIYQSVKETLDWVLYMSFPTFVRKLLISEFIIIWFRLPWTYEEIAIKNRLKVSETSNQRKLTHIRFRLEFILAKKPTENCSNCTLILDFIQGKIKLLSLKGFFSILIHLAVLFEASYQWHVRQKSTVFFYFAKNTPFSWVPSMCLVVILDYF